MDVLALLEKLNLNFFVIFYTLMPLLPTIFLMGFVWGILGYIMTFTYSLGQNDWINK